MHVIAISLLLVGNNSLVEELRCLTSIELYLNSEFYGKHVVLNQRNCLKEMAENPSNYFFI